MRFRLSVLAIFASIYLYLAGTLFWWSIPPGRLRTAGSLLLFGLFTIIAWVPLVLWQSDRERMTGFELVLQWIAFSGMGIISFVLVISLVRDLTGLIFRLPLHTPGWTWTILGLSAALFAIGVRNARFKVGIQTVQVPVPNLAPEFSGLRIVQITDLHAGPTIKRPFIESVVKKANSLAPDLLVLTGDIADGTVADLCQEVEPLSRLAARYGKFYVPGNHEYYWEPAPWIREFESLGLKPLLNQHVLIEKDGKRLALAGVPDFAARMLAQEGPEPAKALHGVPESAYPRILLAHQPKIAPLANQAGYQLQISGHTHGGQFFPWTLVVNRVHRFPYGLHQEGNIRLYVSRGTGYWGPPVRMGSPAEITLLILEPAAR